MTVQNPAIVLDVLRPSSLTFISEIEFDSGPTAYGWIQHPTAEYIYAVTNAGITVLDISTRSAQSVVGVVTDAVGLIGNEAIHGLAFDSTGRYLYATSGATSLYTFDLGAALVDIEDPALVDTLAISAGGNLHVLTRLGSTLWILADSANNIEQIDLSTPNNPSITSTTAATTIALACRTGFANTTSDYISYPSGDASGKIGSFTVASPATQTVFQCPTLGSGGPQIVPTTGLYFLSEDLLYLVAYYTVGTINHYFWMVLDLEENPPDTATPITTETVIGGVINNVTATVIASTPLHVVSVGTFDSTYNDLGVFIRDDTAGNVGELRVYRANTNSTVDIGRVPRLVASCSVTNSYSLYTGYGSDVTEWSAVGLSADRSNALCALIDTDLLSFTDDDSFTDITGYYLSNPGIAVKRGISGDKPTDRVASTGVITFELDNTELNPASSMGGLSPDAASPAITDLVAGAQVRLAVSTDFVFRGTVQAIETTTGANDEKRVKVTAVDIFDALGTRRTETLPVQTNATVQDVVESLLDALPPLPGNQTIENLDFRLSTHVNGTVTQEFEDYDFAFDRAHDEKTAIVGEIQKVMNSERGYFFSIAAGGVPGGLLRYQSLAESISKPILTPVFDDTIIKRKGIGNTHSLDNLYNVITVRYYPRKVETASPGTTVLFTLQTPARIKAGGTLTINAAYHDPAGLASRVAGVDMIAPVAGTDYLFRSRKDGTGSNLNSQLSVSARFGGTGAIITAANAGPRPGWLTTMQLRGNGIYSQEPVLVTVKDSASIAIHGPRELFYDMPYTTDSVEAKAVADTLLAVYANPRTFLEWIEWFPTDSAALVTQFLSLHPGSKIAVQETVLGHTDTDYWVLGIDALDATPAQTNLYGLDTYQVQKLEYTIREAGIIQAKAHLIPSDLNRPPSGWNEPRNWTAEIVTPELFKYFIAANENALFRKIARQTADVASTTTTFADLTGMTFQMRAGETWTFWVTSFFVSNTTADVKYTVVATSLDGVVDSTAAFGRFGLWANGTPVTTGSATTFGNPVNFSVATTLEDAAILTGTVSAVFDCFIQIQGAQNSASGTTTFRENSFLAAFRLEGVAGNHTGSVTGWTNPQEPARDQEIDSTWLNTYLRDNVDYLKILTARQTADVTKNADTTLANLTGLSFAVLSGEVWAFIAVVFVTGNATADAKFTVTAPASTTGRFGLAGAGIPLTAGSTTTFGGEVAMGFTHTLMEVVVSGYLTAGGNGTVQVQAAQNTSDVSDTTFFEDSILVALRVSGTGAKTWGAETPSTTNFNDEISHALLDLRHVKSVMLEDIVVNNNDTFEDLTGMSFKVRSGEAWIFLFTVYLTSLATADAKFTIIAPTSSTGRFGVLHSSSSSLNGSTETFGDKVAVVTTGTNLETVTVAGIVTAAADGVVTLQGAQNTAIAGDTTFYAESSCVAFRRAS